MKQRLRTLYSPRMRHRSFQVAVDAVLLALAYGLAFYLRFDLQSVPHRYIELFLQTVVFVVAGKLIIFALFGLYQKWWRYVSLSDMASIIKAVVVSSVVLVVILVLIAPTGTQLPRSVAAVDFFVTMALIMGVRFAVRSIAERPLAGIGGRSGKEVLIVGAGDGGRLAQREMVKNRELGFTPIGFVDDDTRKHGMRIDGLKVFGTTDELVEIVEKNDPDEIIIAIPSAPGVLRQKVVTVGRDRGIPVRTLPTVFELLRGGVNLVRQIRDVQVEDVLGRQPMHMEVEVVGGYLKDLTVMVTGAGGSIGSELCRQISTIGVEKLIMLDHAEDNLFEIERQLVEERHYKDFAAVLADCREEERMAGVFAKYRPDVVFHAAAYKHVPLMEENPLEAVRNNAIATKVTAQLAAEEGAKKFVLVSTDKAVRPITVMGASKAMAEWVVKAWGSRYPKTLFASVRFGNVLASSGSVVPIFRRQIAAGGPVTVTHPDMTRYFMTIPEAVQLIIRAGGLVDSADQGATYVLDMGEPVKIIELARKMIRLSGAEPDKEIAIDIIGPRPGEKLKEELFNSFERPQTTSAAGILKATEKQRDPHWVVSAILQVEQLVLSGDEKAVASKVVELSEEQRQLESDGETVLAANS